MKRQAPNREQLTPQSESTMTPIRRQVTEADIATRAYEIFQSRGGEDGSDLEDWLQAERELTEQPAYAVSAKSA